LAVTYTHTDTRIHIHVCAKIVMYKIIRIWVSSVGSICVCRVIPLTVYLFIFKKPRDAYSCYTAGAAIPVGRQGWGLFLWAARFVQNPTSPHPTPGEGTLRIQFRNCADLWTTVLCQRPLETVQRTIKVIGSGEWVGGGCAFENRFPIAHVSLHPPGAHPQQRRSLSHKLALWVCVRPPPTSMRSFVSGKAYEHVIVIHYGRRGKFAPCRYTQCI